MTTVTDSIAQRFLTHVEPDQSGCILWRGCIMRDGYGKFTISAATEKTGLPTHMLAHRFSWVMSGKDLPKFSVGGLTLDHTCNVRNCVNVDHLEVVTHAENRHRAATRRAARLAKAT